MYNTQCKKNPTHAGFIPVKNFKVTDLPPGYHDNDIVQLVKHLSDLTVRISASLVSMDRPKVYPDTTDMYPLYDKRGNSNGRSGTGKIHQVQRFEEGIFTSCPCLECVCSDSPKTVWWKILVLTSKHVVFDDNEAETARCRLWYDDDSSPVVVLNVCHFISLDTKYDWCELHCVTHDANLAASVGESVAEFERLSFRMLTKYNSTSDKDKVTIIVSHPHGCPKQVSVGQWVHVKGTSENSSITRYTYTCSTCTGSSGAFVYRLGWAGCTHCHSGSNTTGYNYSGFYIDVRKAVSCNVDPQWHEQNVHMPAPPTGSYILYEFI